MIPTLRKAFNESWTEERYRAFLAHLHARIGTAIEFPVSETPCFLPRPLVDDLARTGEVLIRQAISGTAGRDGEAIVPNQFRGPGAGDTPTFVQVDFGLVRSPDGNLSPRLVELQAFPSFYGFQVALAEAYRSAFTLPPGLDAYLGDLTPARYQALLRDAIVGDHDPAEVVLMEIEPDRQKTRPDFVMTEQLWGVRAIDTAHVIKQGRQLFYRRDGRHTPIRRIYNRVIPDELNQQKRHVTLRLSRRSRRPMGRAPGVVFPHQQVFDSLPHASVRPPHLVPARGQGVTGRS